MSLCLQSASGTIPTDHESASSPSMRECFPFVSCWRSSSGRDRRGGLRWTSVPTSWLDLAAPFDASAWQSLRSSARFPASVQPALPRSPRRSRSAAGWQSSRRAGEIASVDPATYSNVWDRSCGTGNRKNSGSFLPGLAEPCAHRSSHYGGTPQFVTRPSARSVCPRDRPLSGEPDPCPQPSERRSGSVS